VVHFDGIQTEVYWAQFPPSYLRTLRDVNIDSLHLRPKKVELHHTRRYNLMLLDQRTEFIKQFVALLRFIAAGEANVGYLSRKAGGAIHRTRMQVEQAGNEEIWPGQMAMDEREVREWRDMYAAIYAEYT
jgi:hypothetical protein